MLLIFIIPYFSLPTDAFLSCDGLPNSIYSSHFIISYILHYFPLFTSFCVICCHLTTLNAHHFVVMPDNMSAPFPTSSICMTSTSLRNYVKSLIEQPRPPPARALQTAHLTSVGHNIVCNEGRFCLPIDRNLFEAHLSSYENTPSRERDRQLRRVLSHINRTPLNLTTLVQMKLHSVLNQYTVPAVPNETNLVSHPEMISVAEGVLNTKQEPRQISRRIYWATGTMAGLSGFDSKQGTVITPFTPAFRRL